MITEVELKAKDAKRLYEIARLRGERASDLMGRVILHWLESDGEQAKREGERLKAERDAAELQRLERQRNRYRRPTTGGR